ncbi:hypothetical protein H2198_001452 [Neophaeococcomyces mojaviensis]|uniref:Uncharacterized protein n=1 Tax=Neophaeococcomyces mojaviensis TaxID=3383035 RepID=A0ACC3AH79_9EURO|nr:hypothetical protein H2198_001452 [Knufia sp. JES_112]
MPQTFKDALAVARELGIPFLWIDALCIVQIPEGNSDWQRESVRMGQIYENAICTIAATSAVHAHEGFIARTGRSVFAAEPCLIEGFVTNEIIETNQQPHCVEIETSRPDFFNCVSNSPLNQRGWVMQERALSKRILHFTEHGLFWECSTLKANDWCGEYEIQDLGACRMKESMMSVSRAKRTQHLCPVEWFHFIKQYSRADFSRFQDRLIALSSVARAVQPVVKSKYLAGLWSNDLIRGLEWYVYRPDTVPRGGKAPTWSWASVTGAIDFSALGLNTLHDKLVDVLDVELLPMQGMDVYGDLQQGNLTIKGTLTTARLPKVNRHEIDDQVYWDEPHMDGNVVVAEQHDLSEVAFGSYTVLPTGMGFRSFSVNQKLEVGALILEPVGDIKTNDFGVTESVSGKYRRKGWMLTDEELLWSHISKKEGRVLQTNMRIYRGMSKIKSMGISWKELNPVEVCII